jgi:hypothetical protein
MNEIFENEKSTGIHPEVVLDIRCIRVILFERFTHPITPPRPFPSSRPQVMHLSHLTFSPIYSRYYLHRTHCNSSRGGRDRGRGRDRGKWRTKREERRGGRERERTKRSEGRGGGKEYGVKDDLRTQRSGHGGAYYRGAVQYNTTQPQSEQFKATGKTRRVSKKFTVERQHEREEKRREGERVCVCVCVCESQRDRER